MLQRYPSDTNDFLPFPKRYGVLRRRISSRFFTIFLGSAFLAVGILSGCGTTKYTDTSRTATEQLLLSNAMDQAVNQLDLRALANKKVYVNDDPIAKATDSNYLVSLIRQHTAASGGLICDKEEDADYILEIRSGAIGTDHHDLLYGIPAVQVPAPLAMMGTGGSIPQIPEIPLIKKTKQTGVVKVSLFAYNRHTGSPIWQSGNIPSESKAKSLWVFGAGPFQKGNIYEGTSFAGQKILPDIELVDLRKGKQSKRQLDLTSEAYFIEPKSLKESTQIASPETPEKVSKKESNPPAKNAVAQKPPGNSSPPKEEARIVSVPKISQETSPPAAPQEPAPSLEHPEIAAEIDDDARRRLPVPSQYGPPPALPSDHPLSRSQNPAYSSTPPPWQQPSPGGSFQPNAPSYTPGSTQYAR
jgi:hypothetical protein